ncbi:MAG: DUF975 family protein [Clostridia bacterium]|nr:DUF975 family protein [Clostridia bacterium]MDY5554181.1 DUF975 family protein [Blautia sp.]
MTSRRDLKTYARQALSGKYGTAVLALVLLGGLSMISDFLSGTLFPSDSALSIILGNVFAFILSLLVNVAMAGMSYMYLNMARNREYSIGDLLYFYKNRPDRVITASFILSLINLVMILPSNIYANLTPFGDSLEAQTDYLMTTLLLTLAGMVLYQILTIPLEMTYYLLADHPEMKGMEALKNSVHMMKGKFWKLLALKLSFVPLMLFSVFTFYLALLWVIPYMNMAIVMFYRDLNGELKQPQNADYFQSMGTPQGNSYVSVNDINRDMVPQEVVPQEVVPQDTTFNSDSEEKEEKPVEKPEEKPEVSSDQHIAHEEKKEEEDDVPKPWDDYFNSLKK